MSRLLASERVIAFAHLLQNVTVADGGAHQLDPVVLQRALETDVAHDGRDDRVAAQLAALVQIASQREHHVIAAHHHTGLVDEKRPVGVAVEGHADDPPLALGDLRAHGRLQRAQIGRSAADVDACAVVFAVASR